MLNALTIEKLSRVLEVADVCCVAREFSAGEPYHPLASQSRQEKIELDRVLNALSLDERAELAALFYSGRDGWDFADMLKHGRAVAGEGFASYIGGKSRLTHHVRTGLRNLVTEV